MDDLGSKLKRGLRNLFSSGEEDWKEKGQGRKLGGHSSAPPGSAASRHHGQQGTAGTSSGKQQQASTSKAPTASITQQSAPKPPPAEPYVATPPQPLQQPAARVQSRCNSSNSNRGNDMSQLCDGSMTIGHLGRSHTEATDAVQSAALANVVMANTPTASEWSALGGHLQVGQLQYRRHDSNSPEQLIGSAGALNTPTAAERNMGLTGVTGPVKDQDFHCQQCLALIVSQDEGSSATLTTMYKIMRNILNNPTQPKFRSVRLSNPAIQTTLVNMRGALEFMDAVGFRTDFHPAPTVVAQQQQQGGAEANQQQQDATSPDSLEGFLVLPDDASLHPLVVGLHELTAVMRVMGLEVQETNAPMPLVSSSSGAAPPTAPPASTSQSSSPTAAAATSQATASSAAPSSSRLGGTQQQQQGSEPAPAVDRQTQVVLPVAPDTQVPDWVFERTGVDLKAEVSALAKRRAAGEVLMTRAWRERMAGAPGTGSNAPQQVMLRVRFPEGICLQGYFGAREPLTRIFEWVTESLRYMEISYELITPSRKPLSSTGTVKGQPDLWPAAVLNFRTLGGDLQAFGQVPYLSDAMLKLTCAE